MLQLYTAQAPFAGWNSTTVLLRVLRGGRPARPAFHQTEEMSEQLYSLLKQCWDQSWVDRPSAPQLLQSLGSIVATLLKGDQSSAPTRSVIQTPAPATQQTARKTSLKVAVADPTYQLSREPDAQIHHSPSSSDADSDLQGALIEC